MSKAKIDLANLDFSRTYSFEEFELINEQLKTRTLEVNGQPVNLFDLDKNGKLVPMPQATHCMEVTVSTIVGELYNWNVQTRQNGLITTSQGGFNFSVGGQITIRAPDVSFTPKAVSRRLTELQRWTFQGQPFTPTFIVEVGDTQSSTSAFGELDNKFKREYFADGTSVQLGWLIDPKNRRIWVYKRNQYGNVFRRARAWEDVEGGDILPGFTLKVWKIDEAISQESSETSSENEELQINCPECDATFSDHYTFTQHYEDRHARYYYMYADDNPNDGKRTFFFAMAQITKDPGHNHYFLEDYYQGNRIRVVNALKYMLYEESKSNGLIEEDPQRS
ncbi:16188_t:CDS:2 [Acaulospora colombiana]|uniref:16188_t:CDS:1 n=1 Tax=Acaulospora colombiana TaxID=27376 RepID=A0ACA9L3M6_9GLOM|nr:16188_t:CDS:2 [Acaulospora colombiana]